MLLHAKPCNSTTSSSSDEERSYVICTLVIPRQQDSNSIFLAKKARGFGIGKWVGFGGKIEQRESIDDGAVREFAEETGLDLSISELSKIGLLLFTFACRPNLYLEVHVYQTFSMASPNTLCDEFSGTGAWFPKDSIPYNVMWKDFSIWSSKIFQEKRFRARVHYNDFDTVLCSVIADVEDPKDPLLSFAGWN